MGVSTHAPRKRKGLELTLEPFREDNDCVRRDYDYAATKHPP
jgi:hypothetical protein